MFEYVADRINGISRQGGNVRSKLTLNPKQGDLHTDCQSGHSTWTHAFPDTESYIDRSSKSARRRCRSDGSIFKGRARRGRNRFADQYKIQQARPGIHVNRLTRHEATTSTDRRCALPAFDPCSCSTTGSTSNTVFWQRR